MITIDGVSKRYKDKEVLREVSLAARDGQITYLLGPNGAGKSSLMRMIAGLNRPDRGTIRIDDQPLTAFPHVSRRIGFNLNPGALQPTLSAAAHLRWQADLGGVDRGSIARSLAMVGLSDVATRPVGKFSLGMQQRLGIASALLGNPKTLVLDEPANGLDVDGILWLRRFLLELARKGRCLLIASHDLPEVSLTGDRIVVMGRGRVLSDLPRADMEALGDGPRPLEAAYLALTRESVEYRTGADRRDSEPTGPEPAGPDPAGDGRGDAERGEEAS